MKIKLVFLDWVVKGESIYSTEKGFKLSTGSFHSGSTFDGEIFMTAENEKEIKKAINKGCRPCFWIAK